MKYLVACFGLLALLASRVSAQNTYSCPEEKCKAPSCRCMSNAGPIKDMKETVQFVMLTFDDAINIINYDALYKNLFAKSPKTNTGGCNIAATFFASHEYNNYAHAHNLYRYGSEIAIHSISHESSTDAWKNFDKTRWLEEIDGMRKMIAKFGAIPEKDIRGFRSPFLQTAGDTTFETMHSLKDIYDCSMPTRLNADSPIWPYTLDYGFAGDCVIQPCPKGKYPGMWIVPMVSLYKKRNITGEPEDVPCAMADGCLPYPESEEETLKYLTDNFNRHYKSNKAPFPVFLHAAWLADEKRKKGFLRFIDDLVGKPDVYIVTIQEVLEYLKNPVPLSKYKQKRCVTKPSQSLCTNAPEPTDAQINGHYCDFQTTVLGGPRIMYSCSACPSVFPWRGNIEGKI